MQQHSRGWEYLNMSRNTFDWPHEPYEIREGENVTIFVNNDAKQAEVAEIALFNYYGELRVDVLWADGIAQDQLIRTADTPDNLIVINEEDTEKIRIAVRQITVSQGLSPDLRVAISNCLESLRKRGCTSPDTVLALMLATLETLDVDKVMVEVNRAG